jgi:glutamyl-tRNA synthetase
MTADSLASRPRVRFAPSPTGFLHVGGARTALFNWLYARQTGGQCLLRIEDTDRQRSTEESTRAIFDGLAWLGLDWDESVVYQGANLPRHQEDARRLLASGAAYCDFTPAAELERRRAAAEAAGTVHAFRREDHQLPEAEVAERLARGEPYAIRFRVPEGTTEWEDRVHGRIAFPNADIEDFIILRSDGTPVYNMAVVSDDIAMAITLVMRGDDHISNTPKQILLYRALGAPLPAFAHVPMIHGADGKKLSKRHGATAVAEYQHLGIVPSAMVNFLALLGWSPGDDTEVMDRDTLVTRFSLDGLQKKAAVFDTKKLEWMNGQHLMQMEIGALARLAAPAFAAAGLATVEELEARHDWFCLLLTQLRVRARLLDELVPQATPFFGDAVAYEQEAVDKQWRDAAATAALLDATADSLDALPAWEGTAMEGALRALAEARGISGGKVFQPLRVALTGRTVSPGIFEVLELLGRERSVARIRAAAAYLRG